MTFSRAQNRLLKSRIPPQVVASSRHPPLSESLSRSRLIKFSRTPAIEMSASRSLQDIFIPYPSTQYFSYPASCLNFMPHPASRIPPNLWWTFALLPKVPKSARVRGSDTNEFSTSQNWRRDRSIRKRNAIVWRTGLLYHTISRICHFEEFVEPALQLMRNQCHFQTSRSGRTDSDKCRAL